MSKKVKTHRQYFYLIIISLLFINVWDVSAVEWSQHAGGNYTGACNGYSTSGGSEGGYGVVMDNLGNSYVAGIINADADIFGVNLTINDAHDIFVAKLDAYGDVVWAKQASGSDFVTEPSIDIDSNNNIFVTGRFRDTADIFGVSLISSGSDDGFIAKLNSDGDTTWAHKFGGTSADSPKSIFIDNSDNVYIAGSFYGSGDYFGTTISSAGSADIFVMKMDNDGNGVWAKSAGNTEIDQSSDVAVDSDGNVYITGSFSDTVDFFGTSLSAGGTESWAYDAFVAKLDSAGVGQWAKSGGDDINQRDYGDALDVDENNNVYITGRFKEDANIFGQVFNGTDRDSIFVVKLNGAGELDWGKYIVGTSSAYTRDIKVDNDNLYITGGFYGTLSSDGESTTSNGSLDVYYGVLNSADGIVTHLESFGGSSYDAGEAFAVDNEGLVYFTGRFKESMNMFGTDLISYGCYDVFLSRIEDNMAPDRYDGSPSGEQLSGTTSVNLQLNTENDATCGYATVANTPYASMTTMETTGTDVHIQNVTGLSDGTAYNYYIRCTNGNENISDFIISFSVASGSVIRADVDQDGSVDTTDAQLTLRNVDGFNMSGTNWMTSLTTGNVNCIDGTTAADVSLILRYSLGFDMDGTGWCEL